MDHNAVSEYFLGANSKDGFFSLYDEFIDFRGGEFLWVIKGGPGCGKSSFMKRIGRAAENAGLSVEYIRCSGDPNSVDGLWLPELKTGYVDGTAPHVVEAVYPGCASLYLDLGAFYDAGALSGELADIAALNDRYRQLYARAYRLLSAASLCRFGCGGEAYGEYERSKLERRARGIAAREFKGCGNGQIKRRFLSAVCEQGLLFMQNTVDTLCTRVCTVENRLGMAGVFLDRLAELAVDRSLDMILCPDPLDPDRTQALLIPSLSLAFLAVDTLWQYTGECYRHIRLDKIPDREKLAVVKASVKRSEKNCGELLESAVSLFRQAKALHDRIESIYNPHVDFDGLYAVSRDHIDWLFDV